MLFALASSGDVVLFLMIVVPLAIMGLRKIGGVIDKDGKIHDAAQKGAVGWLERWFKK
jgi:hypothetical protein